uniref:TcpE family conjugal transfer membrane protein n=1 Tax=Herbidospora sakaeratensis TaxID=564415 RepID=UPI000B25A046|nr:TcpE family conjugal transfer membrane protein [Herbidospora sakaeratensis]
MDLPTYTNIWRIEKRLYKLYDLRLPMPLPIVWIGVFVGVSAFWWVLLQVVGLPFDAPWHVIYLVPPGIVTWLSTRPVIEGKRLTELLQSQTRYFSEPKTWCRLAPSGEPDVIDFQAKVWRASTERVRVKKPKRAPEPQRATVRPAVAAAAAAAAPVVEEIPVRVKPPLTTTATAHAAPEPVRRLIGHPDDKQTALPEGRRPATFGQPPRLIRPVGEPPADPAKDRSRPLAATPLRPALLAHPSDQPTTPEAPESPTRPLRRPEPQVGETPPRPLQRPETPERETRPLRRPETPARGETGSRSQGLTVPMRLVPGGPARPGDAGVPTPAETGPKRQDSDVAAHTAAEAPARPAEGGAKPQTPEVPEVPAKHRAEESARAPRVSDVPVWPVPDHEAQPASGSGAEGGPTPPAEVPAPSPAEADAPVSPQFSWSPVAEAEPVAAAGPDSAESGAAQSVQEEGTARVARHSGGEVADEESASAHVGRHAAAVPPARVEPEPADEPAEEISSPPIRPDALRRLRRLAASADSAVEPEAPAPAVDWQKERLRKGQPPAPFIPAERGSEATWRRVSQVVAGSDGDNDEDRARTTISGSRRIVVLGCTGGAGQTTTTLLLGHSLARLREDGVVVVDANSGGDGLTGRITPETPETLSSFLTAVDGVGTRVRDYTTRTDSGLDVLAADVDPGAEQRIGDRGWFSDQRIARAMRLLDQQYRIILMDPAAALAARLLPYADQLVLVAPASADAPDSVAMTYDWLDGHGCADLRRRAVVVINGVSRRSMADVERAETVARGRCRAIVRVPWEDELAEPGQVDLDDLRSGGRRAYVALAGVVASGLTTARGESFVG